jgi:hypothetical protein
MCMRRGHTKRGHVTDVGSPCGAVQSFVVVGLVPRKRVREEGDRPRLASNLHRTTHGNGRVDTGIVWTVTGIWAGTKE